MNLEQNIKSVIDGKLNDGTVERIVGEKFEESVKNAIGNLFESYGDVTKIIEKKIKEVMVDRLSSYDYSSYIVKLDYILTEILEKTTLDNRTILGNFKELMVNDIPKTIKLSDVFNKYQEYVKENVETDGLDVDYDCEITYEPVDISIRVEEIDKPSWSSFSNARIYLECEHDDQMNREFEISRWDEVGGGTWSMRKIQETTIQSLRFLDEFTLFLIKLTQSDTKIELDITYDEIEVTPEEEPEPSYS